jgi:hypothetical protein
MDQKPAGSFQSKPNDVFLFTWHYARVVEVDDPYRAGRIKVEIPGIDNDISWSTNNTLGIPTPEFGPYKTPVDQLPWCEPLMPKYINVVPKIGETVKVTVFDLKNKKQRREYIGPVISQQRPPSFENPTIFDAEKVQNNSDKQYFISWLKSGAKVEDGDWKIYPDIEDISFIGRSNTDFILRDKEKYSEIILRAGKIDNKSLTQGQVPNALNGNVAGGTFPLNEKNPAYITINFTKPFESVDGVSTNIANSLNLFETRSHINLVADSLNLISHKGSSVKGLSPAILGGDKILEQIRIENNKLHPLVYGDILWEFLSVLRPFLLNHIHKGSRREPDGDVTKNNLITWFDKNMGNEVSKPNSDGSSYTSIENCTFLSKGVKTN